MASNLPQYLDKRLVAGLVASYANQDEVAALAEEVRREAMASGALALTGPDPRATFLEPAPVNPAARELAARSLARRRLLPFVMRMREDYKPGWVHRRIALALEKFSDDVIAEKSPRLMISMPPRHGKSLLASQLFPSWHLGRAPTHEVIAAAYALSLPMEFSRTVRDILREPDYQRLFDTRLSPDSQNVEAWKTTKGGGYRAAGVGGPLTGHGAHCFPAGTPVLTNEGVLSIEQVTTAHSVVSFDTMTGSITQSPVKATHTHVEDDQLCEITTVAGRAVRATADHRFFVPGVGWVEARNLKAGDPVLCVDGRDSVWQLRQTSGETVVRGHEGASPRLQVNSLLEDLHGNLTAGDLSDLRRASAKSAPEILLDGVLAEPETAEHKDLSAVRSGVPTEDQSSTVLFSGLRQSSARTSDGRRRESALQGRNELCTLVPPDALSDPVAGQRAVRSLRSDHGLACSPCRRGGTEQSGGQSDHALSNLPPEAPQVQYDSVSSVVRVGIGCEQVYDIQVGGTSCYFAGTLLAHNCAIVDDPVKNWEEAQSDTILESIWRWYTSTFYSRLAPGAGVLVIQTRWNDRDLSGRLRTAMDDGSGDQWEILEFEALASKDEAFRAKGEALHPERYNRDFLLQIQKQDPIVFETLYQQKPTSESGGYFQPEMFRLYDELPPSKELRWYATWDLAITANERSNYSVGIAYAVDSKGDIFVADLIRERMEAYELVEAIIDQYFRRQPEVTAMERGHIQLALGPYLDSRIAERKAYGLNLVDIPPGRKDKEARARSIQGLMRQGRVFFPRDAPWLDSFRLEMLSFPNGKFDDTVDAMAYIGLRIADVDPTQVRADETEQQRLARETKMRYSGAAGGHMTFAARLRALKNGLGADVKNPMVA